MHVFSMRPTGVQYMLHQLLKVQETQHVLSNVSNLFFYQSLFLYKVHVQADVAFKRSQPCHFVMCCLLLFFFWRMWHERHCRWRRCVCVELQMCSFFDVYWAVHAVLVFFFVVAVKRLFRCCVRFKTATLNDDLIVFKLPTWQLKT